ncbi:hypothetical protein NG831_06530 [Xanthomonas sacchari]|uniref:hypothetical protein n=1 Tax=Xanthomonas sacchari TaxID=56458 RepID=UPI0022569BB3|nr:hypothetical protein [Xanthomonas sacchari]MCW0413483.1 hypothetical protein [Xanthomonas sacchari]UYK67816.1 hypothetical protein NG831_06530 [Xanthomonas sacchari]
MATKTLTQVTLLIDRDASTKLPAVVFDYEHPLIEEIYGEELVHELESKDVKVENFDVQAAFDGLVSKYGANAESDRARKLLYPKLRDLEKRLGFTAEQAKAGSKADDSQDDGGSLADGTVADITAKLPKLSDEELDQLEEDEQNGKQRAGLMSAIEAERKKRDAAQ